MWTWKNMSNQIVCNVWSPKIRQQYQQPEMKLRKRFYGQDLVIIRRVHRFSDCFSIDSVIVSPSVDDKTQIYSNTYECKITKSSQRNPSEKKQRHRKRKKRDTWPIWQTFSDKYIHDRRKKKDNAEKLQWKPSWDDMTMGLASPPTAHTTGDRHDGQRTATTPSVTSHTTAHNSHLTTATRKLRNTSVLLWLRNYIIL